MDVFSPKKRSEVMSRIRGKNTKPEMIVRHYLHAHGLRYRLHAKKLRGRPDVVLPRHRAVVFVHGCFWHQHSRCKYAARPSTNATFWQEKLSGNVERDARTVAELENEGWRVFTIWECALQESDLQALLQGILGQTANGKR
jgi:DNA mismatch endonuclease (patch repair protein)